MAAMRDSPDGEFWTLRSPRRKRNAPVSVPQRETELSPAQARAMIAARR